MAYTNKTDGLVHLLKRDAFKKGVRITIRDNAVSIELHIIVDNGVNLTALCRSIMNEVKYKVSQATGATVQNVDVCVDSMLLG